MDLDAEPRGKARFVFVMLPVLGRDGCPDLVVEELCVGTFSLQVIERKIN